MFHLLMAYLETPPAAQTTYLEMVELSLNLKGKEAEGSDCGSSCSTVQGFERTGRFMYYTQTFPQKTGRQNIMKCICS